MKRIEGQIALLESYGVTWPARRRDLLRYRGIGTTAIAALQARGMILDESANPEPSARVRDFLRMVKIATKEELKEKWESGAIRPERYRNVGPHTLRALREWCGAAVPVVAKKNQPREKAFRRVIDRVRNGVPVSKVTPHEDADTRLQREIDARWEKLQGER
jgi:hypothetical protein